MNDLRIHIIGGTGEIGNWLRVFLESVNLTVTISGKKGVSIEILGATDILFLSVPISATNEVINTIGKDLKKDCLLVDLSSIKSPVVPLLKTLKQPSVCFHMLFGPTISTLENQKIIVTRIKQDKKVQLLINLFKEKGAAIIEMNETRHDKTMAYLQNLTHFMNIIYGKTLLEGGVKRGTKTTTPVFLAQTAALNRVLTQNPNLLTEIQLANPFGKEVIRDFLKKGEKVYELITKQEKLALEKEITQVHKAFSPQKIQTTVPKRGYASTTNPLLPKKASVAYLGPEGTYSHLAVRGVTTQSNKRISCTSIYEVFEKVERKEVQFGVVPAENTTEGTVRETLDYLIDFDFRVNGSIKLPIHHSLLSFGKDVAKINQVFAHPQAIAQSRKWLQENLPDIILSPSQSNLSEVENQKDNPNVAFIGSKSAAKLYGLQVLAEDIETTPNNFTEFYIISKDLNPIHIKNNHTILFVSIFNRVGILRDILTVFASQNINLTNIESRPSREKAWDYHFFIEIEVSLDDPRFFETINILKQHCPAITVLGGTI